MVFTAWKIFQKGGAPGWQGWVIGILSLLAMYLKAPERLVILIAALVGILLFR
jgi:chromate transport protein ChrA